MNHLLTLSLMPINAMTRVAVKFELKNKRKKELPLSREVEMLTMLHEGGHHADADDHNHDADADADDHPHDADVVDEGNLSR